MRHYFFKDNDMDFKKLKKLNYKRIKTNLQIAIYLLFIAISFLLFVMRYKTLHHFLFTFQTFGTMWHGTSSDNHLGQPWDCRVASAGGRKLAIPLCKPEAR